MPKRTTPKQAGSHLLDIGLKSTLKQADEAFSQGLYNEALNSYLEALNSKENQPLAHSDEIIHILYQTGHVYKTLSQYTQAFGFFEQALAMIKPDSKQIPPYYILLLNSMGECELNLAKYKEAHEIFEKCTTLLKKHKIKTGSDLAKVNRNLALLNREQGQFKEAIKLINSSIHIYAQDKNTNPLDFAIAFLTRGDIYLDLTKLPKASLDIEQTFKILKENYSTNHPLNASAWNSQSVVYSLQGKYKEAEECFNKAINISRKSHGDTSLEIARGYRMLGLNKIDHGELDQAFDVTNKAHQIYTEILGPDHPATIITLSHLGNVYRLKAQYEKSDKILQETLEAKIKKLGNSHPEVATSYRLLGRLEEDQGRFQEALQHYKTSLVICEAVFQGNQYDLAASHSDVGAVYQSLGNFDEGLEHYEKALDMTIKLFGRNHPDVAVEYSNIGLVYGEVDDTASEIKYYKKALCIQKALFGEDGNELVVTYHNLGVAFGKIGQYVKALAHHRRAMDIGLRIYGPNHPSVAISHYAIGVVYEKKKDYTKAMKYNLKSLKIRRDFLGNRHPDVAASCRSMGLIYGGIKDKMLQNKFLLKAYHTKRMVFGREHDDTVDVHEDIQNIEKDSILLDRNYE